MAAVICGVVFHTSGVEAQSFLYAQPTGTVNVPFVLDTSASAPPPLAVTGAFANPSLATPSAEFVSDPYGDVVEGSTPVRPAWATRRIAANLLQRYRIIGNPFLRSAALRLENFSMNPSYSTWWEWNGNSFALKTSTYDYVAFRWFYSPVSTLTGSYSYPVTLSAPAESNNSLMFPGVLLNVVTGRDGMTTGSASPNEGESWGFESSRIEVSGGAVGNTLFPTLTPYDSTIAVLMPNDDIVDTLVSTTGHIVTVTMWAPQPTTSATGVTMWSRCGAPPTFTANNRVEAMAATGGGIIRVEPCPSGQTLHVAFTNTSGVARAIRIFTGSNWASREWDLTVAVAWNATPAQLDVIRARLRRSAWMFFGLTGGTQLIRSYRVLNNRTFCDNTPATACDGGPCHICFAGLSGGPDSDPVTGYIDVYFDNGEDLITHELGHTYGRTSGWVDPLPDEDQDTSCRSFANCAHTWMATLDDNKMTLCTPATHGRTGISDGLRRSSGGGTTDGPWSTACGVTWQQTYNNPGWPWLNGRIPVAFPSYQTPEVLRLERLWANPMVGAFVP